MTTNKATSAVPSPTRPQYSDEAHEYANRWGLDLYKVQELMDDGVIKTAKGGKK